MASASAFWQQVLADGLKVPVNRPLDDMTAELTMMLGSPDPELRAGIAYPTLSTWVSRGVFDDLLSGLGDGMVSGIERGLGRSGDDGVFRRSYSVLVLGECIRRDNLENRLPNVKILEWGDRVAAWYVREKDTRGWVVGKGWANAVGNGADAIAALAESVHFGKTELTVLLDVLADRVLMPVDQLFTSGEPDKIARATMAVLRRNLVPQNVLDPWIARLAGGASAHTREDRDPFLRTGNAESFLRALYLQLALAPNPPAVRADLLLVLVQALKRTNPHFLTQLNS